MKPKTHTVPNVGDILWLDVSFGPGGEVVPCRILEFATTDRLFDHGFDLCAYVRGPGMSTFLTTIVEVPL